MPQMWLRCEVSKGMFTTEFCVTYKWRSGKAISWFADAVLVRGKIGEAGAVSVHAFHDGPTPIAVLNTAEVIAVHEEDLLP